jgi:hypothetical protein
MIRRSKSARTRVFGSAGVLGFLLGAFAAGQVMIWLGFFKPGVTPHSEILDHWPGFFTGAVLGGAICFTIARRLYSNVSTILSESDHEGL